MRREQMTDDELLAAYCDGVTELSSDERKRVEALLANSDAARTDVAATRSLIGALRDLPSEGNEPDWTAMEREIRAAVPDAVPRQWWRPVWRWLVPATALATMATIALLVLGGDHEREEPVQAPVALAADAGVASPEPVPVEAPESVAVWLDGDDVVLDPLANVDEDLFDVDELLLGEGDAGVESLLSNDLAWVDELDEDDAAFAEKWLDERKKG